MIRTLKIDVARTLSDVLRPVGVLTIAIGRAIERLEVRSWTDHVQHGSDVGTGSRQPEQGVMPIHQGGRVYD
jgi:hypothetical protein